MSTFLNKPLQTLGGLLRNQTLSESVSQSIQLLMDTPLGSLPSDPNYGFVFTGLRFENFDENEGTVYAAGKKDAVYSKKISGSSKNLQTFASDLKKSIETYEKRLLDPKVVMTYIREQKQIVVVITGSLQPGGEPFQYNTIIKIWN